jgi:TPR repeat protein
MNGGTPVYMAPEIWEDETYAWPVDVYAFGILVYVCITLMAPYPGIKQPFVIARKVSEGKRPAIPGWVGNSWRDLITRCWDGNQDRRPTFEWIVKTMSSAGFIDSEIDKAALLAYQQRTLPKEFHLKASVIAPVSTRAPQQASLKTPIERLQEAADAGDGPSALEYAKRLRKGQGVAQDLAKAAEYFRRAAQAGEVHGMIEWGLCCEMAIGVQRDFSEASRWYKAAMDKGHPHGVYCYADMLEYGKGVAKDEHGAVRLYKQAADAGHEGAQARYGFILENGLLGVAPNFPEALRYYKMSSDQGNPRGMFFYADMLEYGKGVPMDMAAAVRLYELAAAKGNTQALGHLGWLAVEGKGVPQNVESGLESVKCAADAGDLNSMLRLAPIFGALGNQRDMFEFYAQAFLRGSQTATFMFARCLENGSGCPKQPSAAASIYQLLIDGYNNRDAMTALGILKINCCRERQHWGTISPSRFSNVRKGNP